MFRHMKIGKKLIIAFIGVSLIVSIAGFLGLGLLINIDKNYEKALTENGFVLGDIGNYNSYINKGGALIRDIILFTDKADMDKAQAELETVKAKTTEALDSLTSLCKTPTELELIARINTAAPLYKTGREKAIALALELKNEEAYATFRAEVLPYLTECTSAGQELMAFNEETGLQVSASLSAQASVGVISIIVVVGVGLVVAIILGYFIARGISKPLSQIEAAAKKMAEGDYDVEITYESKNEIGSLASNMERMIEVTKAVIEDASRGLGQIARGNLNIAPEVEYIGVFQGMEDAMLKIIVDMSETMGQIKSSAEQVSSGSEQVSSGAQALAQGAAEQASSVEELSATISEITHQIKTSTANTESAHTAVRTVDASVQTSNKQMTNMIGAMSDINNSSQEIGKIIKTIEDIAFQTNILALNAAVEAARAGAAGKGFAVVADEVRNLATKSSEAAKQTSVLIESSVKSVENGVKIADDTAKSLTEVMAGTNTITALIEKISDAAKIQLESISQINLGVEQISAVVQTNSATSEESAASSEELNSQANLMKQMIDRFQLKED